MALRIIPKHMQASGAFNGGQIIENKPIGFPSDRGHIRPYSNLFYWARAEAVVDSTIGLHPHQGFEIMSFVLEGQIRHFDTANEEWKPLDKGDVQIIRAGNGIEHSEEMLKGAVMFQIWTDPNLNITLNKPASYSDYRSEEFPVDTRDGNTKKVLIGGNSPLMLDTPGLEVLHLRVCDPYSLKIQDESIVSTYILSGTGSANGESIEPDMFLIQEGKGELNLDPHEELELFQIISPADPGYPLYTHRFRT